MKENLRLLIKHMWDAMGSFWPGPNSLWTLKLKYRVCTPRQATIYCSSPACFNTFLLTECDILKFVLSIRFNISFTDGIAPISLALINTPKDPIISISISSATFLPFRSSTINKLSPSYKARVMELASPFPKFFDNSRYRLLFFMGCMVIQSGNP